MARMRWEAANRRDRLRRRVDPGLPQPPSLASDWRPPPKPKPPTRAQLDYLQALCRRHRLEYIEPRTRADASAWISGLLDQGAAR